MWASTGGAKALEEVEVLGYGAGQSPQLKEVDRWAEGCSSKRATSSGWNRGRRDAGQSLGLGLSVITQLWGLLKLQRPLRPAHPKTYRQPGQPCATRPWGRAGSGRRVRGLPMTKVSPQPLRPSRKIPLDCRREPGLPACCSRKGACIIATGGLLLGAIAAATVLLASFGLPTPDPGPRACVSTENRTGFLCDDRETCIPARKVCDRFRHCARGEDEDEALCNDPPYSLPGFLLFSCGRPGVWVYADQRCDGVNHCGDCADELGPRADCPPCGPQGWPCLSTFYQFCGCVPRHLCRDQVQHCKDWSDEFICTRA
ncbi:low-density lipoprotein receptor class A domain-containing protein 1 [Tachyglossus aculeatus]|uniref:low-density lipoprotein receptor class A domain-containing protein 1 n=1 Tax=Tachyglossus aculeatus TaxID=9261 RepID=UPI0018F6F566|nr:low-density lipoprotein receptor class A domain-containing protein 1 [Tachyglossus aculeatus]